MILLVKMVVVVADSGNTDGSGCIDGHVNDGVSCGDSRDGDDIDR